MKEDYAAIWKTIPPDIKERTQRAMPRQVSLKPLVETALRLIKLEEGKRSRRGDLSSSKESLHTIFGD